MFKLVNVSHSTPGKTFYHESFPQSKLQLNLWPNRAFSCFSVFLRSRVMSAFDLSRVSDLFSKPSQYLDQSVEVGGWLTSARMGKRVGFLILSDGSTQTALQVVVSESLLTADPTLRKVGTGTAIRARGVFVTSKSTGQPFELQAESVTVVGSIEEPERYPVQPKMHTPEFLRTVPHLRARVAGQGAVARLRHQAAKAIHAFFEREGFLWIATPLITTSDAEGAGARFRVSTEVGVSEKEFFGKPAYLTVSGQMEAEALCAALGRVYTFGPTFRAEPSQTTRHLAEFWMVEPEMAFATLLDIVSLAERLIKHVARECLAKLPAEMDFFAQAGGWPLEQWDMFVESDFKQMTYTDAIRIISSSDISFLTPVSWGMDLHAEHEKALVSLVGAAVIVTDYPEGIKPFYMKVSSDGCTVAAMDILLPGVGEIVGGSLREDCLAMLDVRMRAMGLDPSSYESYRDLRRYGSVPHGGFGLGFERLIAFLAGVPSVRDAIAYPRAMGSLCE